MKRLLPFTLATLPLSALAGTSQFAGPLNTLGHTSTPLTLLSASANPAAGEMVISEDDSVRWGYLSNLGIGFEYGEADRFVDELDRFIDELDRLETDPSATPVDAQNLIDEFDGILEDIGDNAYLRGFAQVQFPLMPLAIRSDFFSGVFVIDAKMAATIEMDIVDSPLTLDPVDPTNVTTDSVVFVSSGIIGSFGLGYSHDFGNPFAVDKTDGWGGRLIGGVRVNYYTAQMGSQVQLIEDLDEDEVIDVLADDYEANKVDSTAFGLDLGALWVADNYQLGITLENLNEPEFDRSNLGTNCSDLTGSSQNNCLAAVDLISNNEISTAPYVMETQITLEGAITTKDKHWILSGSYDVNDVQGMTSDRYQWVTASASYFSESYLIPAVRFGYRANLTGSELSYVSGGLTIIGGTHIDLSFSLDKAQVDGSELPRYIMLSIGFESAY